MSKVTLLAERTFHAAKPLVILFALREDFLVKVFKVRKDFKDGCPGGTKGRRDQRVARESSQIVQNPHTD